MASSPTTRPNQPATPATFGRRTFGFWSPGILLGLIRVVGRRLWSHMALMLAIAAGFVVAIALVVSIPVYAEAVGYRILRDELGRDIERVLVDGAATHAQMREFARAFIPEAVERI